MVARSFSQGVPAVFRMAGASLRVDCESARPLVLWLKAAITARESQTVADWGVKSPIHNSLLIYRRASIRRSAHNINLTHY